MGKIDKTRLMEMKAEGISDKDCAKAFGCSAAAISEARRRLEAQGKLVSQNGRYVIEDPAADYISEKHLQTETEICPSVPCEDAEAVHPDTKSPAETKTVAEWETEDARAEAEKQEPERPFPQGVLSRRLFWEGRRDDLRRAICEFACEGMTIDPEWVEEYNELVLRKEGDR